MAVSGSSPAQRVPLQFGEYITANFAAESTGDKATYAPSVPIVLVRWGWINVDDAAVDVGTTFIMALDHRPTTGSDTNRVALGTITTGTSDVAQGYGLYNDFDIDNYSGASVLTSYDGSTLAVAPSDPANTIPKMPLVLPGQELVFEVTDAADTDADALRGFLHFYRLPFVNGSISALARLTKKAS